MSLSLFPHRALSQEIGKTIYEARRAKGWTARRTAEQLHMGRYLYLRIEAGQAMPDTLDLAKMIQVLDLDVNKALGDTDRLAQRVRAANPNQRRAVGRALRGLPQ